MGKRNDRNRNNNKNNNRNNNKQNNNSRNDNNNNNNNKKNNNNNDYNQNNNNNGNGNTIGLTKHEYDSFSEEVLRLWKDGYDLGDIIDHLANSPFKCPVVYRCREIRQSLADGVSYVLKTERLMDYKGCALPLKWPYTLQIRIAELNKTHGKTPEEIRKELQNTPEYKATFPFNNNSHLKGRAWMAPQSAIGHFIVVSDSRLDDILAGNYTLTDVDDRSSEDDYDEGSSLLESISQETWAKGLVDNYRRQQYDPNYVDAGWQFRKDPPKFGEASKFVIRQAELHDPMRPDPVPDPVRPVATGPIYDRKCQGSHGCSRHCTWNRDFNRHDGWSQHTYNNKYGISMYLQESTQKAIFEDADGDVLMADNWPPWVDDDPDGFWRGQRVNWTRSLASEAQKGYS